jgi:hypothetical protein
VLYLPGALDADEHTRHIGGADRKRRLTSQAPHPEMLTLKEALAPYGRGRLHHGRYRADCGCPKIDAGKGLLDLEWA